MYFPLIVHEALMVEPCETEAKQLMDEVCDIYCKLYDMAYTDPRGAAYRAAQYPGPPSGRGRCSEKYDPSVQLRRMIKHF